jgi:hypothetical protein
MMWVRTAVPQPSGGSESGRRRRVTALAAVLLAARGATAAMTPLVQTGTPSPVGWIFSSLSGGSVDGSGRAVFGAGSSAVFARSGDSISQAIGPGTALGGGRSVIGTSAPTVDANGCVIARTLVSDGRQAMVRTCGGSATVLLQTGDSVAGGSTLRSLGPTVFAVGAKTIAFSGILSDGIGALLRRDESGIVVIALTGGPAPTGGTFTSFRLAGVSAAGRVGFQASVSQGPDGLFAATETSLTAVVSVGQGSPIGGSFSALAGASLSPLDRWVFAATLSTGVSGIFQVDGTSPTPLVRTVVLQGEPAPIVGATFRGFPSSTIPSINASGVIAFRGLLEGGSGGAGIFVAAPGMPLVAIATTRLETAVGLLSQLRDPVIADDGSVVVPASVAGIGPGIYAARDGALSRLAQIGDPTTSDVADTRFRFSSPSVRPTAESAVFLGERNGVFRRSSTGAIEVIAYTGQRTPIEGFFTDLGIPVVDGRGRIVFGGGLHRGTVNEGVFSYGERGLAALARPGERAAGGGRFNDFFPSDVDDLGRPGGGVRGVALVAALEATGADEGLFLFSGSRARVLAKSGRRAAGERLVAFGTPALGDRTHVAFVAQLDNGRRAMVVSKGGGALRVVAEDRQTTRTRLEGQFTGFAPPAVAGRGAVFRATLSGAVQEGIFLARGRALRVLAAASETTTTGDRLRSFGDVTVSDDLVFFPARLAGDQGTAGLYRVSLAELPAEDAPAAIVPVVRVGDAGPSGLGGVVVQVEAPGPGPDGSVASVVELADAPASSVLAWIVP